MVNPERRSLEGKMVIAPESGERANEIWKYIQRENPSLEELIKREKVHQETRHSPFHESIKQLQISLNTLEGGLLAQAYAKGTSLHLHKADILKYPDDPLLRVFHTNELVIMPLKGKDEVKALIVADNLFTQKPITAENMQIFTMLANQAGLAIENAQLYELVVYKSHTDSLTNLWNHGYFQQALSVEIEKSRKNQTSLSLLIIDIDNFKNLNDKWGHQNGDFVLKELAEILRESSRTLDYVCRYGGEEFSMILTQTQKDQAFMIAERIRNRIEQYHFKQFAQEDGPTITVSIGVASFSQDAQTKEELIAFADKAMYIAKFSGKNKTCVTQS
jgi:diguanylate cyclase (GGDEF)-like protein